MTTAKLIAVVFVIMYFLSPVDIVPDLAGPVSAVDDVLVAFIMAWSSGMLEKGKNES